MADGYGNLWYFDDPSFALHPHCFALKTQTYITPNILILISCNIIKI